MDQGLKMAINRTYFGLLIIVPLSLTLLTVFLRLVAL